MSKSIVGGTMILPKTIKRMKVSIIISSGAGGLVKVV